MLSTKLCCFFVNFSTAHLNNELWEIENNKYDWELRYLHQNYSQSLEENATIRQPCPGKLTRLRRWNENFCASAAV